MKNIFLILAILVLILAIIAALWGVIMSHVEQAKYIVVQQDEDIEIRDYDPMVVAEVVVPGNRETAIKKGFHLIADYIFGNNHSSKKVAMTAPVTQQNDYAGTWKVQFVMPATYSLKTLPTPLNEAVKLKETQTKRYVVIRFSGVGNQKRLDREQKKLANFIAEHNLTVINKPIFAFFNPPWTLPFLRRNEIMIEIKK